MSEQLKELMGLPWSIDATGLVLDVYRNRIANFYGDHELGAYAVACANHGMQNDSMNSVRAEVSAWAQKTFPYRSQRDVFMKLVEEVGECAREPASANELADVLILALDLCTLAGHDAAEVVREKMAINRERRWVFNQGTGTHQHAPMLSTPPDEADLD